MSATERGAGEPKCEGRTPFDCGNPTCPAHPATPDADDASERVAPCGSAEIHNSHPMPCDSGCQPDWHRDSCAIYGTCPGLAASTDASGALSEAEQETIRALRREIGPLTERDHAWQPMVSAGEVRVLLDCIDRLARESAAATRARAEAWTWVERLASEWDLTEFPDERTATILRADLRRLIEAAHIARGDA